MAGRINILTLFIATFLLLTFAHPRIARGQCSGDFILGAPTSFNDSRNYRGGAVGDFNGDGAFDAAFIDQSSPSAYVFYGLASEVTAAIQGPTQLIAGSGSGAIAAYDFNRDGITDLAICSYGSISVFLGQQGPVANAAFSAPIQGSSLFNGTPSDAAAADFNGDGIADLALSGGFQGGAILVLFGRGQGGTWDGTFQSGPVYLLDGNNFSPAIGSGDFDGDGRLDLVALRSSGRGFLSVLKGTGDGGFREHVDFPAGPNPYDLVVSDLSGDGLPDVAVSSVASSGGVTVFTSIGADAQENIAFAPPTTFPSGALSENLAATDLNNDGKSDLLVAGADGIAVLEGIPTGDGTAEFGPPTFHYSSGDFSLIKVGDFNGDGRTDVIAAGIHVFEPGVYGRIVATFANDCLTPSQASPAIESVRDVPLDQGGRLKLSWTRSGYDRDHDPRVSEYWIWRSVPTGDVVRALSTRAGRMAGVYDGPATGTTRLFLARTIAGADSFWEFVTSQPAAALPGYSYVARTPYDSTGTTNPVTAFFVQARTSGGAHHFDSNIASGYSVDNLPPRRPRVADAELISSSTLRLHWRPNPEDDLSHYAIHRGVDRDFMPSPANELVSTADTIFIDRSFNAQAFYKVTAVDIHENRSPYALVGPQQVSAVDAVPVPSVSYLRQNYPNPFNPETTLEFGVPAPGRVTLRVFDARGNLVRTLLDDTRPVGAQWVSWNGKDNRGDQLPSGVYVARLETQGGNRSMKMLLTR